MHLTLENIGTLVLVIVLLALSIWYTTRSKKDK